MTTESPTKVNLNVSEFYGFLAYISKYVIDNCFKQRRHLNLGAHLQLGVHLADIIKYIYWKNAHFQLEIVMLAS